MKLKQKQYPDKTTVNLIVREQSPREISRAACLFLILALSVGLFCKFGVIDRLSAATQAERTAAAAEQQLEQLRLANADYDPVQAKYQRYFSQELADGQTLSADCMEVLSLLENTIMSGADVSSVSFSGTTLTVRLTGVGLNGTSDILAALSQSSLVTGVDLSTADDDAGGSAVSMTVALSTKGGNAS